jgi:DNA-directed RNA polymerase specialized sigma24 family protein
MPDEKTDAPDDGVIAIVPDEPAPVSSSRPSSPSSDASVPGEAAPSGVDPAANPVTPRLMELFLAKNSTQDRIRQVVAANLPKGATKSDIDEVSQRVNLKAMSTASLPRSVEGMRPWISTVAANATNDYLNERTRDRKRFDRTHDVSDLPDDEAMTEALASIPMVAAASSEPDEPLVGGELFDWLSSKTTSKADKLTLEMIRTKAVTNASNTDVAAEFGMSVAAYDNRLLRFKAKWVPQWKRYQRARLALLLLIILLLLAMAALAWWIIRPRPQTTRFPPTTPSSVPVLPLPSASSTEGPPRFDQALPPTPSSNEKK